MKSKSGKYGVIASMFLAFALAGSAAAADDTHGPPAVKNETGYHYSFDDDPLQAGGLAPLVSRIAIAMRASRATLIRPRTAFVVELCKSVEHL